MKVPEIYRVTTGLFASDRSYGCNGHFLIPHYKILDYFFFCVVSDGEGWEHVSVSLQKESERVKKIRKELYGTVQNKGGVHLVKQREKIKEAVERCPTWAEMCFIKSVFWNDEEAVMQLHPPKKDHVNMHEYCLHLWKPLDKEIPLPDKIMVGV